ncbi:MAG: MmcQ/YjbR family DNA-binding protein [Candidatus Kapaibacteriota bacterium]
MDLFAIREYCLSKPFSKEDFPFDEDTLVFKVFGRMFALLDISSNPLWINLKASPVDVVELCERYDFIRPGYHMNKKYWITVEIVNKLHDAFLFKLIDNSYIEVTNKLPKYQRKMINEAIRYGNLK